MEIGITPSHIHARFVAEHQRRNLRQRCSIRAITYLAANFQLPARIHVFLRRFVGLIGPYTRADFTFFDGVFLWIGIALFRVQAVSKRSLISQSDAFMALVGGSR